MGRLIYSMSVSLDGFVESAARSLDWVRIDEELHTVFNDEARSMSAFIYGTRMYELMAAYWPTAEADPNVTPAMRDFARIWLDMPKIVISRTLATVGWNARLIRHDAHEEIERLKAKPGFDMDVGGPTVASALIEHGLVDEYRVYVHPVILGAGTRFFPALEARIDLQPIETRTFTSGVTLLRYEAVRKPAAGA